VTKYISDENMSQENVKICDQAIHKCHQDNVFIKQSSLNRIKDFKKSQLLLLSFTEVCMNE